MGICNATKRDGGVCSNTVNMSVSQYCQHHQASSEYSISQKHNFPVKQLSTNIQPSFSSLHTITSNKIAANIINTNTGNIKTTNTFASNNNNKAIPKAAPNNNQIITSIQNTTTNSLKLKSLLNNTNTISIIIILYDSINLTN